MLVIWTGSTADSAASVFSPILKTFRPDIPKHQFKGCPEDCPVPAPVAGELVLVCGNRPLDVLRRAGLVQKNRTVSSMREMIVAAASGGHFLITFDPAVTGSEPDKREVIEWDTRLAVRFLRTGKTGPDLGKYQWVNSFQPVIDYIEAQFKKTGKPVEVATDTETMGFYPWYPDKDIVSISFTAEPRTAHVLYLGPQSPPIQLAPDVDLFAQINWLLTTPKVRLRLANGKYDLIWIAEKWGIECTNFKFDTMLVGSLVDENRCVDGATKLLTSDLRWIPASTVSVGTKLVGFDEHVPGKGKQRRLWESVVTAVEEITKPRLQITFSSGVTLTVSDNHQLLVSKNDQGQQRWQKARDIKIGQRVKTITSPPGAHLTNDFDLGRLSGFLDGEGSVYKVSKKDGVWAWNVTWAQKPGVVNDDIKRILNDMGLSYREHDDAINVCKQSAFKGSWWCFAGLIASRPLRLIGKKLWEGAALPREPKWNYVTGIKVLPPGKVVSITTSTKTFVAEGVASHNSNSLSLQTKVLTDLGGYDQEFDAKYDKSHMERIPANDLFLTYAGGDTDACLRVATELKQELAQDEQLANFYVTVLHPAARAFERIERRGVAVDAQKFSVLSKDLEHVIKDATKTALELLPQKMRIKYRERIDQQLASDKSPLLPTILKEFFFTPHGLNLKPKEVTEKTGEPSMTKAHLRQFADVPAAAAMVKALTDLDVASKTKSTFVDGFMDHLRPDGRLHPTYFLAHGEYEGYEGADTGTVTGRLSAKNPPIQLIPKKTSWAKRIRECFVAPEGKVVASLDYVQGELKVVACIAPEPTMIAAYEQGLDLHAVTGARIANIELALFMSYKDHEDKKLAEIFSSARDRAKPANFGLLYGMSAEGFMHYAWASYGRRFTLQEAEAIRNAFFALYPGLTSYHARMKGIAKFRGQVRTPMGRVRHLPTIKSWDRTVRAKAERQAVNCLSDDTEILTATGWKTVDQLSVGDAAFTVDPATGALHVCPVEAIHKGQVEGTMLSIEHRSISAMATPNHSWLVDSPQGTRLKPSARLSMHGDDKIWLAGNGLLTSDTTWTDDEVELMGWVLTDGFYVNQKKPSGGFYAQRRVGVTQSKQHHIAEIDALFQRLGKHGKHVSKTGQHQWTITSDAAARIRAAMPEKTLTMDVLLSMSHSQRQLLFVTMLAGDGCWDEHSGRYRKFAAGSRERAEAFSMLCALIGQPARFDYVDSSDKAPKLYPSMNNVPKGGVSWYVELAVNNRAQPQYGGEWVTWSGRVWCPTMKFGTWIAKRNGKVFVTGNSPVQGALTDMMVWALALIDDAYPNGEIETVAVIHDAMIAYLPAQDANLWAGRAAEIMSNLPFHEVGWKPQLKFTVDAEIGPNLANLSKLKFAA